MLKSQSRPLHMLLVTMDLQHKVSKYPSKSCMGFFRPCSATAKKCRSILLHRPEEKCIGVSLLQLVLSNDGKGGLRGSVDILVQWLLQAASVFVLWVYRVDP